jgi:hypothetical protein
VLHVMENKVLYLLIIVTISSAPFELVHFDV